VTHGSFFPTSRWDSASAALRSAAASAVSLILSVVGFGDLRCVDSPPNFRPPVIGNAGVDFTLELVGATLCVGVAF